MISDTEHHPDLTDDQHDLGADDLFGSDKEERTDFQTAKYDYLAGTSDKEDSHGHVSQDDNEEVLEKKVFDKEFVSRVESFPAIDSDAAFLLKLPPIMHIEDKDMAAVTTDSELKESLQKGYGAQTTIRWKTMASDPAMQNESTPVIISNTNVIEWSDGSRTLAIGNTHFDLLESQIEAQNTYLSSATEVGLVGKLDLNHRWQVKPATRTNSRDLLELTRTAVGRRVQKKDIELFATELDMEQLVAERNRIQDEVERSARRMTTARGQIAYEHDNRYTPGFLEARGSGHTRGGDSDSDNEARSNALLRSKRHKTSHADLYDS